MAVEGLFIDFEGLPVSVNSLYFVKYNRMILTKAGREFKTRFIQSAGGSSKARLLQFTAGPSAKYTLVLSFHIHEKRLVNKSYGLKKSTKYKYKKFDTSNLIKCVEDAVSELLGIPDQNNFSLLLKKVSIDDDATEKIKGYFGKSDSLETLNAIKEFL